MIWGILGWVAMGLIVGFVVSKLVNLRGDDPRIGIGAACGGAILAGVLYSLISGAGVTAWNPLGLLLAFAGAVGAVIVFHLVRSRYISHETYVRRRSY